MHHIAIATLVLVLGSLGSARAEPPSGFTVDYEHDVRKVLRHGRMMTAETGERWLVLSEERLGCEDPLFPRTHHAIAMFDAELTRIRMITFNTAQTCYPSKQASARSITATHGRVSGHIDARANSLGVQGSGDFDVVNCPTPFKASTPRFTSPER